MRVQTSGQAGSAAHAGADVSEIALIFSALGIAVVSLLTGFFIGALPLRRRLQHAEDRHDALQAEFEIVSAINARLTGRTPATLAVSNDPVAEERFFELYDAAKHCLHRTLDQHNSTAPRPLVISRDGGNLLQVLSDLPERSFSDDRGEDAGVRAWLRRVFELDIERRATRAGPQTSEVLALEREREIWRAPLKKRA